LEKFSIWRSFFVIFGGTLTLFFFDSSYNSYFIHAQKIRRLVQQDFEKAFTTGSSVASSSTSTSVPVDIILTPAAFSEAPRLADVTNSKLGPVDECINDVMTVPASLAGIPAMVVPFGRTKETITDKKTGGADKEKEASLPIGVQLMARFGEDEMLFRVGKVLEKAFKL
jgi:aspartyl-tRNA(Asn)/glutamyl-tRNA(Gln) amidotransferase subunit A